MMITAKSALPLLIFVGSNSIINEVDSAVGDLLWSEEFDQTTLNTSLWNYNTGTGGEWGLSGWGNNELQSYSTNISNVNITNGALMITAIKDEVTTTITRGKKTITETTTTITSGRIHTNKWFTFKYGTLEARARLSSLANGAWPAFWTLGSDISISSTGPNWPFCGEMDIMEMGYSGFVNDGTVNYKVTSAAHWEFNGAATYPSPNPFYDSTLQVAGDDQWVTFKMDWNPSNFTTYVNDVMFFAFDLTGQYSAPGDTLDEFKKPHFILLNLAVGGNFVGITNVDEITTPFPATFEVDYIRLYDNGHTNIYYGDGNSNGDGGGDDGGGGGGDTCDKLPSGEICQTNEDCCSNNCKGGGTKRCKG